MMRRRTISRASLKNREESKGYVEMIEEIIDRTLEKLSQGGGIVAPHEEGIFIPESLLYEHETGGKLKSVFCVQVDGTPVFFFEPGDNGELKEATNPDLLLLKELATLIFSLPSTYGKIHPKKRETLVYKRQGDIAIFVLAERNVSGGVLARIAHETATFFLEQDGSYFTQTQRFRDDVLQRVQKVHTEEVAKRSGSKLMKVALIGDGAVGKTSIRKQFLGEGFSEGDYLMTIGADFATMKSDLSNGVQVKWQIWDLAGQPRFNVVTERYFGGSVGALIIFDVTRPDSFRSIPQWIARLWEHSGEGPVSVVLIGNKIDLRDDVPNCVTDGQAQEFVKELSKETEKLGGFQIAYVPTSAKTGENIQMAFDMLGLSVFSWLDARAERDLAGSA